MRSLKTRLILSHILPLAVTIPLIGVALTFILQSQVLLSNMTREVQAQAVLLVELTRRDISIWYDPENARAFVTEFSPRINAQVMLLDSHGQVIAASDPEDLALLGQTTTFPGLEKAMNGETSVQLDNGLFLDEQDTIDMTVPVVDTQKRLLGVIRLKFPLTAWKSRFDQLQGMVGWVAGGGLLAGVLVGWFLALSIERPLRRATDALANLTPSQARQPLPEEGPTEIRQLFRAYNQMQDQLTTAEQSRKRLLANLVHELGRPIGAMRSAVQALRGGAERQPELRGELLAGMDDELSRLRVLLEDLAHLNEQAARVGGLDRKDVDLAAWLPEILAPWREAARSHQQTFEYTPGADLPTLSIDSDRLGQALGNLLSNAIHYTPAGGVIRVRAEAAPEEVRLAVADSGPGIPAAEQDLIFSPFYRGSSAKRFSDGMGLGLTIARDLVEAHGGRLELDSPPGQGAAFTITLPRR